MGAEVAEEFSLGIGAAIGEGALRKLPDALVGIEFGGVAREAVELESGIAGLQHADGIAGVDRTVVP